jgi:hypothetical protein
MKKRGWRTFGLETVCAARSHRNQKKRLSLTDVFRVSVLSFESRNLLITLLRTLLAEVLNFAAPDACIMKQKLLNPPGESEGQGQVEALRVALNC